MNILIASSIHEGAIERLRERHSVTCRFGAPEDELVTAISDAEVLVFRSGVQISRKVLKAARSSRGRGNELCPDDGDVEGAVPRRSIHA